MNTISPFFYKIDSNVGPKIDLIKSGPIDEMIEYAKKHYDIFTPNSGKFYQEMCELIKQRLDKEGLSHEVVRPTNK